MSRTLPQQAYFSQEWKLPGAGWTLSGHSRALERTGFWLKEPRILLDAGVDLPTPEFTAPRMILVSHTHIDHCNALPMLLRHTAELPTHIFVPRPVMNRLRQFTQLSWAMKVDWGAPIPDHYAPPAEIPDDIEPGTEVADPPSRVWRPVEPGLSMPVAIGKGGHQVLTVKTFKMFHTVSTAGYAICEQRQKLRPELEGATKKETGENVKAAKARGEEATMLQETPIVAFLCDTTAEVLADPVQNRQITSCSTVIIECTYLQDDFRKEAIKRGHVVWADLRPYVEANIAEAALAGGEAVTWVLVHWSLRHTDEEIREFFQKDSGMPLSTSGTGNPNLVLWLNTGIVELWVATAGAASVKDSGPGDP